MSFTDDAVKAKLKGLNHTQESIVTVAQWVMFHRRYAERQAQVWLRCLQDSRPNERVNLIYVANEVAQQSKARGKEDFVRAFAPILPQAVQVACQGADTNIVSKIYRVVEVWRQRQIFDIPTLEATESRLAEITGKQDTSGSTGSSTHAPSNLQSLIDTQTALSKADSIAKSLTKSIDREHQTLITAPGSKTSSPPGDSAKFRNLVKTIASAESAVSEVLDRRREIIASLEALLQANRTALSDDEAKQITLSTQKEEIRSRHREVASGSPHRNGADASNHTFKTEAEVEEEVARPEMERFTPPPVEALTPPAASLPDTAAQTVVASSNTADARPAASDEEDLARSTTPPGIPQFASFLDSINAIQPYTPSTAMESAAAAAMSFIPPAHQPVNSPQASNSNASGSNVTRGSGRGSLKRRRTSDDDFERIGFGAPGQGHDVMEGLDEDVVGMLG